MLHLKRTLLATLLSLSLFSINSHAEQNYQTQLLGGYTKIDADTSTHKLTELSAEIYFSPVNTENKPLAEAAFLDKSSSIGIGYFKQKTELPNTSIGSFDVNGPAILLNYITDTNNYILGALYADRDLDTDSGLVTGDIKNIGFSFGKYLDDSSTIEFSYLSTENKQQATTSNQTFSNDTDQYNLSYKTVQSIDTTRYYGVGASIELIKSETGSVKEDNHELEILGQYYFTLMTSLGVEASFNSGDDVSQEGRTLGIEATHFFIPQIAANIGLSRFTADDSQTEDDDLISIELIARF